jgi:DNA-binding transcriptional ArsR family regulator
MQVLNAIADPTRQRIVEMLAARELSAGHIAGKFDMSAPAISQHLKVLREAKLVRVRADAQRRIYALDPEGLRRDGRMAHAHPPLLAREARSAGARAERKTTAGISRASQEGTRASQEGKSHE